MKKKTYTYPDTAAKGSYFLACFFMLMISFMNLKSQSVGDFRSYAPTLGGNWNDPLAWERYNGSIWEYAGTGSNNPGQIPGVTSSVFILNGHTILIDALAFCKNMSIESGGTLTASNNIEVSGNWVNNGSLNPGSYIVEFTKASGTQTVNNGASSFYTLHHTGSGTLQLVTNNLTVPFGVYNFAGALDLNSRTLNLSYEWFNNGNAAIGNGLVNFTYDANITGGTLTQFDHVTIQNAVTINALQSFYLSGNWTNNGNFVHNNNTVTLNGSSLQTIGGGGNNTFYHVTLNNPNGAVITGTSLSVYGTLILNTGNLDVGTESLLFGQSASVFGNPGFSAANMIVADGGGLVAKFADFGYQASFTYPVGDNNGTPEYSPITLAFNSGTFTGGYSYVSLRNTQNTHDNSATNYLNRYWIVNTSSYYSFNCNVLAHYAQADVIGIESKMKCGKWNGAWTKYTTPSDSVNNYFTANGVTSFSEFTMLDAASVTIDEGATEVVCQNGVLSLHATASGAPVLSYTWSGGLGTGAVSSAVPTATPGNTVYTVTVTDGNGLTATASITVTVNAAPLCQNGGTVNINCGCDCPPGFAGFLCETALCSNPTLPTLSTSSATNCGTQSTTLSINTGILNDATDWQWYSGSCGGTSVGSGTSVVVSPAVTTTYYARGEGGCVMPGSCGSITITVNPIVSWYLDADNDGYYISSQASCSSPGVGWHVAPVIGSGDCNDGNASVYPGTTQICYTGPPGTSGVGTCHTGTQTCLGDGTWSACGGQIIPVAEICNGLDDNCNGIIDEGFSILGEINLQGGSPLTSIADGDITAMVADSTDFGAVSVGATKVHAFTIQNTGTSNITISSITSSNVKFVVSGSPTSIIASGSATFNLTFSPTVTGLQTATITINNNDCDEAVYDFSVQGAGCETPTITCPGNQTAFTASNSCDAIVNYSSSATGSPAPTITYSFSGATTGSGTGDGSGSAFNKGTTSVTLTATNACGNSSCSFNVVVADNTPPTISCAANVTINNTPGLCTGATTLTAPTVSDNCSVAGNALDFDGSDDYVNCGVINSNVITVEAWVKPVSLPNGIWKEVVAKWVDGSNHSFELAIQPTNVAAMLISIDGVNGVYATGTTVLTTGQWYHLAGTYDGSTIKIYLNGVLESSTPLAGTIFNSSTNVLIGATRNGTVFSYNWNGSLDEVRIWNVARSQAQIQASMNTELSSGAGLIAAYHLNEGISGGNNAAVTTAADASGNGNDGTLNNFALSGVTSNWVGGVWPIVSNNATATYPLGNTTVTWTATDASGNTATCDQTVTVVDNQAPTISGCPGNQTLNTATGTCAQDYVIPYPTLADNCAGPLTWNATFSGNINGNPTNLTGLTDVVNSPSISFNKGITVVTLTSVDASNNVSTAACTFTVTIVDNQVPDMICSGAVTINNTPGLCSGTVVLTPPVVSDHCGNIGNALHFDGANDIISFSGPFPAYNNSSLTLEAWIKSTNGGPGFPNSEIVTWSGGGGYSMVFRLANYNGNGRLQFLIYDNVTVQYVEGTTDLNTNTWNHVAMVKNGNSITLYLNGNIEASGTVTNGFVPANFYLGGGFANWDGTLDEVRIWHTARTQAQIQATMNLKVNAQPGLAALYHLDEGIANANNTAQTIAFDASGNGFHGNLTNFALAGTTSNWVGGTISSIAVNNNAPSTFPIGTTNVVWTATDASGNTATCNQVVTVIDNQAPLLATPKVLLSEDFESGGLAPGWTATGLWHITNSCAGGSPLNPTKWAYFGTDANCDFNNGTVTGSLSSPVISIPASATNASISFWKRYNGEGNPTEAIYDLARFRINGVDQTVVINGISYPANGLQNGLDNQWQRVTVNANAFIGQNVTLSWFFNSVDGFANGDLGLQIDSIRLVTSDIVIPVIANTCAANYTIADPISDNCTGSMWGYSTTGATTLSSSGNTIADGANSGVLSFNKGVTVITLTGLDGHTNAAISQTYTLTVVDNQAPGISACPGNQNLNTEANSCTATYSIPSPAISDNCTGPLTWNATFSGNANGNPSNLTSLANGVNSQSITFNKGTTTVTLTAMDANGNASISNCTFTVTVLDTIAPVFTCPANISENNTPGLCGANLTIPAPVVSDNCTSISNALDFNGTPNYATLPSGVYFNGAFTIECWVYPKAFSNWSRIIDFGNGAGSNNVLLAYTFGTSGKPGLYIEGTQIQSTATLPLNQWSHVAATFSGGTGTIYVNGIAAGSGSFPTPANVTRNLNYVGRSNWGLGDPDANAVYDELRIWNVARTQSQIQAAMSSELTGSETGLQVYFPFNQGVACGNNTAITQVLDMAPAGGASNATLFNFTMNGGCNKNFTTGYNSSPINVTNNAPSIFPIGTTNVLWTATDVSGNMSTCTQVVTVTDNEAPVLSFSTTANTYLYSTNSGVSLEDLSAGATQLFGPSVDDASTAPIAFPFAFNYKGISQTQFSVSSNGLLGFGPSPVYNLFGNSVVNPSANDVLYPNWDDLHTCTNGSVVYKVTGNSPNRKLVIQWNVGNFTTERLGTFTKTIQAWLYEGSNVIQYVYGNGTNSLDGGSTIGLRGTTAADFNVVTTTTHANSITTVNDANVTWPGAGRSYIFTPSSGCPANISVNNTTGQCGVNVSWAVPTPTDNCGIASVTSNYTPGDFFPVGTTTVNYVVTDIHSNVTNCSFNVTVTDNQRPSIICPANIVSCDPVVTYTVTASDNCGPVTLTYTQASGTAFAAGVTTVKAIATDMYGNKDSCTFTVTVNSPSSGSSNVTMCDSYTWVQNSNTTYTVGGTYVQTFTNAVGCDSVHTLSLTINYSSASTTNVSVPGCYVWNANGASYTLSGVYAVTFTNSAGCDSILTLNLTITPGIFIAAKAILTGPYNANTGLMHDSLRVNGLIPFTEPYSSSPYNKTPVGGPGGETVSPAVLAVTGANAIVDWVMLEIRNAVTPSTVIANKRALLQRDGDIVSATDGVSPVFLENHAQGNYFVSVKHRNHIGVMTASAVALSSCTITNVNFTTASPVYTNPMIATLPRKIMGSVYALWSADANNNKNVKYNGLSNDKDFIAATFGFTNLNNTLYQVYRVEDVNMDGKIRYNNTDNDRAPIIENVGPTTPNVIINQHTPN